MTEETREDLRLAKARIIHHAEKMEQLDHYYTKMLKTQM